VLKGGKLKPDHVALLNVAFNLTLHELHRGLALVGVTLSISRPLRQAFARLRARPAAT
jgi:hypothetical protein